jgi:Leucine-rich repeat (LRR) protein
VGRLLHDNRLQGNVPSAIGNNMPYLNRLYAQLQHRTTTTTTTSSPTALLQLTRCDTANIATCCRLLHNNQLTGGIPESIGTLQQLEYLTLHNNQLTGNIPSAFGNLMRLQYLYGAKRTEVLM